MADPVSIRTIRHGVLKIKDGGANSLTIPVDRGELTWTVSQEVHVIRNRQTLHSFVKGLNQPMDLSFSCVFQEWKGQGAGGADPSPADALLKLGNASAWASTSSNTSLYTVNLEFTISGNQDEDEVLSFSPFAMESADFAEAADGNTLSFSGKALMETPTSTRS